PGGRRARQGRAERQGLRISRRGAADPCRRAAGRRRSPADPRNRRGRRRRARRRRRHGRRAARAARALARGAARRRAAQRGVARQGLAPDARRGVRARAGGRHVRRVTSFFFLAALFCVTFEKIHWNFAGTVSLADVLAILFLISFVATTARFVVPRTTVVLLGFFAAFLLVYLAGYFNLTDS